jgi:hypothetical protein
LSRNGITCLTVVNADTVIGVLGRVVVVLGGNAGAAELEAGLKALNDVYAVAQNASGGHEEKPRIIVAWPSVGVGAGMVRTVEGFNRS